MKGWVIEERRTKAELNVLFLTCPCSNFFIVWEDLWDFHWISPLHWYSYLGSCQKESKRWDCYEDSSWLYQPVAFFLLRCFPVFQRHLQTPSVHLFSITQRLPLLTVSYTVFPDTYCFWWKCALHKSPCLIFWFKRQDRNVMVPSVNNILGGKKEKLTLQSISDGWIIFFLHLSKQSVWMTTYA